MRVGLVLSVLLSVVATLPAHVQAAPRVGPGTAWIGKGFRRGQSKADEKSEPPSAQSEVRDMKGMKKNCDKGSIKSRSKNKARRYGKTDLDLQIFPFLRLVF